MDANTPLSDLTVSDLSELIRDALKELAPSEYMTRAEVAKYLRVTPYTVADWARTGVLRPSRIGGRLLYHIDDIRAAIQSPTATARLRGAGG